MSHYPPDQRTALLEIARNTIENHLRNQKDNDDLPDVPAFKEKRAVFVTLWQRNSKELRGCIGHTEPQYPLLDAVKKMAISASMQDPRFSAVSIDELPTLQIEINVLTPMSPITPESVIVGTHGLLLRKGFYSGLFLPEVPVSQNWDRLTYLDELCRKAGLPKGSWSSADAELFGFESESWEEN